MRNGPDKLHHDAPGTPGAAAAQDAQAILEERARALARPAQAADASARGPEFVVVVIEDQRFAIELESLLGTEALRSVLPLPGAPRFLLGLTAWRGESVPVFELLTWLGNAKARHQAGPFMIVLGKERPDCAIAVDRIERLSTMDTGTMHGTASHFAPQHPESIQGVTADGVVVLAGQDLIERLFSSAGLEAGG